MTMTPADKAAYRFILTRLATALDKALPMLKGHYEEDHARKALADYEAFMQKSQPESKNV